MPAAKGWRCNDEMLQIANTLLMRGSRANWTLPPDSVFQVCAAVVLMPSRLCPRTVPRVGRNRVS